MDAKNEEKLTSETIEKKDVESSVEIDHERIRLKKETEKEVEGKGEKDDLIFKEDGDKDSENEMNEDEEDFVRWYGGLEDEESILPKEEAVQVVSAISYFSFCI